MIYLASKQAADGMREFAESVVRSGDAVADFLTPGESNGPVTAMGGGAL